MMNAKRLAILALAMFLTAGGAAVADSRWGTFEGYSKVRVAVNNSEMTTDGVPPFVIKGSTMLPLRQVADSLNAIVKWDGSNQSAEIYKPNVNMMVARDVSGKSNTVERITTPFYFVAQDHSAMSFTVFVQVDNLQTNAKGYKVSIIDPSGNEVDSRKGTLDVSQDYLWIKCPFNVAFSAKGNYTVRFALDVGDGYQTVGEKRIVSE